MNNSWLKNKSVEARDNVVSVGGKYFFLHQNNSGQRQCEYFFGGKKVEPENIRNFKDNIELNKKLSDKYTFKYCHLICESKVSGHSDILKKEFNLDTYTLISDFMVDSCVVAPKLSPDDFFITDSHSHSIGSIKHIQSVLDQIGVGKIEIDNVSESIIPNFRGDLFSKLGLEQVDERRLDSVNGYTPGVNLFNISKYLNGNTGNIQSCYNKNAIVKGRLVTFGDSFIGMNLRTWSLFFEEIIHFRIPYVDEAIVASLKPDFVVTSNTERYLTSVPNATKNKMPFFFDTLMNLKEGLGDREKVIFRNLFYKNRADYMEYLSSLLYLKNNDDIKELTVYDFDASRVDEIRDYAIGIESDDISTSLHLMLIAKHFRPDGIYINNKISEYKLKLGV
ncbi:hypothetical protein ACOV11_07160 [Vibrio natriegens]